MSSVLMRVRLSESVVLKLCLQKGVVVFQQLLLQLPQGHRLGAYTSLVICLNHGVHRAVLNGKKKVFHNEFSQKSPRALHVLNHGWWRLAVGGWRLAVGGWQLATGGWWRSVVVGGGWWLVIGGWLRLVVVGS